MALSHEDNQSYEEFIHTVGDLLLTAKGLAQQAESSYCLEVESVVSKQITDKQYIERLLDGMLDFCFDAGMLLLFKKLCRFYFKIDPVATAFYINAYREMWDEQEEVEP